jgi:hypothetical protein
MKKLISVILILNLFNLSSCYNPMKDIEKYWEGIVSCTNGEVEAKNVEALSFYLAKNRIPIKTTIIDKNGIKFVLNEHSGNQKDILGVSIEFFTKDGSYIPKKVWKPKNVENLFLLFRE